MASTSSTSLSSMLGFSIFKKSKHDIPEEIKSSLVPPSSVEGATIIETSPGSINKVASFVDFEGDFKTEQDLIRKYRDVAIQPESDNAILKIVNESIVVEEDRSSVEVVLDRTQFSDGIKKKIQYEFDNVLSLLNFNEDGHEIYKNWYVDGRLYYHVIKDINNLKRGIIELRRISPLLIKKVVEVTKEQKNIGGQLVDVISDIQEYFVFLEDSLYRRGQAIRINPDEICFVHSGILDRDNKKILSHLHKAIKPVNQLRMIEDAVVIYRLARAPERRVFYVDTGNLPSQKAEQYMAKLISQYRNKVTYDAISGEVVNSTNQMSMMEDFWMPRREGGKGTEIDTLSGGQNLGEIQDVEYFQKRMYKSLNVPVSRLDQDNAFGIGRSSEITRDEVEFSKFIARLRKRFSHLFLELLKTQLILKNIITQEEWELNKYQIRFDFLEDNHFAELKNSEIMAERLNRLASIDGFVGRYYSIDWVRKNVLMQTEEEIQLLDQQMKQEEEDGLYDVNDFEASSFGSTTVANTLSNNPQNDGKVLNNINQNTVKQSFNAKPKQDDNTIDSNLSAKLSKQPS